VNGAYVDVDQDDRLLQVEGERAHKDVSGKGCHSCCSDLGSRGAGPMASRDNIPLLVLYWSPNQTPYSHSTAIQTP